MSQKQIKPSAGPGGAGAGDAADTKQYSAESAQKIIQQMDDSLGKVRLTYGAHDIQVEIAGLSVAEAQLAYKDILNVDEVAEAYLNGKLITNKSEVKLNKGDRLQFMKEAGQKGQKNTLERLRDDLDRELAKAKHSVPKSRRDRNDEDEMSAKDVVIDRKPVKSITVPEDMTLLEAAEWCRRKDEEEDTLVAIYSEIDCFPLDGAVAFRDVLNEEYGFVQNVNTPGMFGKKNPPVMVAVPISETETRQVPWGRVEIPGVEGFLSTGLKVTPTGPCFILSGETKQRHMREVNDLIASIKQRLKGNSIYKGKAVKLDLSWARASDPIRAFDPTGHAPKFSIPLDKVREDELVFSAEVQRDIQLGLFTPIENSEACRQARIPLKRGVLLAGDYGTGKTLTAYVTALKGTRNGFTFIYLTSVLDLAMGLKFAQQYEPAIIFTEDVDQVLGTDERDEEINAILNNLDGVDSKTAEIITVLTTNHLEKLSPAVLRPGRCDTLVKVTRPDAQAAARLVALYGRGLLAPAMSLEKVGKALADHLPAEIREAVERAKLATISRMASNGKFDGNIMGHVTQEDVLAAVFAMDAQHKLLQPKKLDNITPIEKAAAAMGYCIGQSIAGKDEKNAMAMLHTLQQLGFKAEDIEEAASEMSSDDDIQLPLLNGHVDAVS